MHHKATNEIYFLQEIKGEDYDSTYTKQRKVNAFCEDLNLSRMGDEDDFISEPCSKGERVCMTSLEDSDGDFFYMYTLVIQDLWVLIPFYDIRH